MVSWILGSEWGKSNMEKCTYLDSSGKEHIVDLDESSFGFAQKDEKLTDVKFKEKPVTFTRDALIRFCKNKSSIVATVILGAIILLSLILPFALPFDVSVAHPDETYLAPKLFKAGTGFFDGTKKYTDVVYDETTGYPSASTNLDNGSILMDTMKVYEGKTNVAYSFSRGGYIQVGNTSEESEAFLETPSFQVDSLPGLTLSYTVETGLDDNDFDYSAYDLLLCYPDGEETKQVEVKKDSTEYGEVSVNIGDYLTEVPSALSVRISVRPIENTAKAVYVKDIVLKNSEKTFYEMTDASKAIYQKKLSLVGSDVSLFAASIMYCSFSYDTYNAKYGDRTMTIGETQMKDYINKGYLSYDFNVGPSSLKILDEKHCPIKSVNRQVKSDGLISVINLECTVTYYKYLGYTKMPVHLFGTDHLGKDMLKYVAEGTRNSLAIGVLIAFITFLFGLVYGAIEGYFGGTVDLIMERIVDILGYIPWIVVVTLCVLHLGQGFGVFILAMCLTGWISTSSITRTQFYRFKKREYVLASRSLGAKDTRLIFTHILPNSLGTIVTSSVLMIPSVIFSEASISYLGIGLKGLSSLGVILSDNQRFINTYPYLLVFPSVVLALMMICFNLFGNGLRDALNPSLKGSD